MLTFGHLGGIDEVGIYVIPILVTVVLVRWLEKRATSEGQDDDRNLNRGDELGG